MSCFRQQTTDMNDQETLCDALKAMKYKPVTGGNAVRGDGSERAPSKCEVVLKKEDLKERGDIGFSKGKDGNFVMHMDTYVNPGIKMDKFLSEVKKNYAKSKAIKIARNAGLTFMGETSFLQGGQRVTRLQFQQVGA